jgi:hypothetical protein
MNTRLPLSDAGLAGGMWSLAIAAAIAAVLVALAVSAAWRFAIRSSPTIDVQDGVVTAENRWGEKVLEIQRFELMDLSSGQVVLRAIQPAGAAISRVRLFEGSYRVETLKEGQARGVSVGSGFHGLVAGHRYRLAVWGNDGAGGEAASVREFVQ